MSNIKAVFSNPVFLVGLAFRLGIISFIAPIPVEQWYIPFLNNSIEAFGIDPWGAWLGGGGNELAFPYGYAMWLFFLPFISLAKLLSIKLVFGYEFGLLMADFGLLLILRNLLKTREWVLLLIYWMSPISLIASYCLGFNDIVPIFFLMSSVYLIRAHRLGLSGFFLIIAISAKLSMVLSLPFFYIYLLHNRSLRKIFKHFLWGNILGAVIFILPFIVSKAGLSMLFGNPELGKIYLLSIKLASESTLYFVPLAYLLMLYVAWRVKRINFELFNAITGITFLLVVLLTPSNLGWFIWLLPLLVSYQILGDRAAVYLTSTFTFLYVLSAVLISNADQLGYLASIFDIDDSLLSNSHLSSLVHTGLVATGIILAVRIWRETVVRNDFFRLSQKPFVIGVAGDSGSGKDTFTDSITGLFGSHSVSIISGDDYHLWDRHQPIWQVMTHVNPASNDLENFAKNLVALTDGKSIKTSHYDHHTGKMSRPKIVQSNDIIIANGLHSLYLPILRECYDLRIFLDIDDDLRTYFKIRRDVVDRGYSLGQVLAAIEKRKSDSVKFIKPQSTYADLIFSLRPIKSSMLPSSTTLYASSPLPRLKLIVNSDTGFSEQSLRRVLIGVCGLHVDINAASNSSRVEISIEGEAMAQDIEMAARIICPSIFEFLDLKPKWQDGTLGLMQLVTLTHINQALTRRFI